MDHKIMQQLLEDDEDENMHSGADVDAFQAALNRDIEGGGNEAAGAEGGGESVSFAQLQSSESSPAVLPQAGSDNSTTSFQQWQTSGPDERSGLQSQEDMKSRQQNEQNSSPMQSDMGNPPQQSSNATYPLQQNQPQENIQQRQGEQTPSQKPRTSSMPTPQQNSFPVREPERTRPPDSESQYIKLQRMSNQQAAANEHANNAINKNKQVPFALLLPVIMPQLDKDRSMQLQTLYNKLKKNEIPKEGFVRHMRSIVGDQMLKMAVMQLQPQQQSGPAQIQAPIQQQHAKIPSVGANITKLNSSQSLAQLQKGHSLPATPSYATSSTVQVQSSSSHPTMENSGKDTREVEHQSDAKGVQLTQMSSTISSAIKQEKEHTVTLQGHNKQQQQHFQFPQTSFPMTGGSSSGNYYTYAGPSVSPGPSTLKMQSHDSQMRQTPLHHSMGSPQVGGATHAMHMMHKPNSMNDPKRMQGGSQAHFSNNSTLQQSAIQHSGHLSSANSMKQEPADQSNEQQNKPHMSNTQAVPSFPSVQVDQGHGISGTFRDETLDKQPSKIGFPASPSIMPSNPASSSVTSQLDPNAQLGSRMPNLPAPAGINARTMPKKPAIGQKKPLEAPGSSPPPSSKKQKGSGAFLDQSIEQLNDVTAVSGVNLREEEEQLFSGSKEDSRASEAIRRVVQEEEERLILQRTPLQKKLAEIMAKFGLKNFSNDVERCLSLCVEERLRGLLCNVIRVSKQRIDAERPRHRTGITSDVRQQIMTINRKAKEEWDRKQAEAEKLRKLNDPDSNDGVTGEKEKDEARMKPNKANKEEDDKMRATAANVAARAAVGGDDMLSKWQLMAEQNRQKREGGTDATSGSHSRKATSSSKNIRGNQDAQKKGHSGPLSASGAIRKSGRNQVVVHQTQARTISVKDVISALEREPQMSKSTLIYRLYDKIHSEPVTER